MREELYALYSSPSIIRVINIKTTAMDRACSTHWEQERWLQNFGGETWGKDATWNTEA
jgi:hypothetical protein